MQEIPFSLVTTCRNEMKSLLRWKQNVLEQTRQPDEIVIVDAYSDDGTFEFILDWSKIDTRIKIIQEKGAVAHGRNVAIENAKNEHILSTDMGVRFVNNWCEELITPFEKDQTIEVVAGNTCLDLETVTSMASWAEYYFEKGGFAQLREGHIPGNRSIAYKKTVWHAMGRLPEELTFAADDSVFGRQLVQNGYKFAFAPKALTYWGRPQKLNQFFKEAFVYGKGDGEAFIKVPRAFKWHIERNMPQFIIPMLSGLINVIKINTWKGFFNALKHGHIIISFYIPILVFGKFFNYSRGYNIGYYSGNEKCRLVRLRIKRNAKGYPLF